jgi:hypothetical protein
MAVNMERKLAENLPESVKSSYIQVGDFYTHYLEAKPAGASNDLVSIVGSLALGRNSVGVTTLLSWVSTFVWWRRIWLVLDELTWFIILQTRSVFGLGTCTGFWQPSASDRYTSLVIPLVED